MARTTGALLDLGDDDVFVWAVWLLHPLFETGKSCCLIFRRFDSVTGMIKNACSLGALRVPVPKSAVQHPDAVSIGANFDVTIDILIFLGERPSVVDYCLEVASTIQDYILRSLHYGVSNCPVQVISHLSRCVKVYSKVQNG